MVYCSFFCPAPVLHHFALLVTGLFVGEIMKMTGNFASVFYFAGLMSLAAFLVCPILHALWWSKHSVDTEEKKPLLDLETR